MIRAGLPQATRFHDLHHGYASMLIAAHDDEYRMPEMGPNRFTTGVRVS